MNSAFTCLNHFYLVSPAMENYLREVTTYRATAKNKYLLEEGQVCRRAWYLEKGLVRCFYYTNGHEVTAWFAAEDNVILNAKSLFEQQPSEYYIEALEDCHTRSIDHVALQYIFMHYPEAKEIRTKLTDWYSDLKDIRIQATGMLATEKRYRFFEQHYGHLLSRLPLEIIASYLGISKSSLTRARRR